MKHTIKLFVHYETSTDKGVWIAEHQDPAILKLMGTGMIPTPFLGNMPANEVLSKITQLNPDCNVIFAE